MNFNANFYLSSDNKRDLKSPETRNSNIIPAKKVGNPLIPLSHFPMSLCISLPPALTSRLVTCEPKRHYQRVVLTGGTARLRTSTSLEAYISSTARKEKAMIDTRNEFTNFQKRLAVKSLEISKNCVSVCVCVCARTLHLEE